MHWKLVNLGNNKSAASVTAEFAIVFPAIAIVFALFLASLSFVVKQIQIFDVAADAARSLGRGESESYASSLIQHSLGKNFKLSISLEDEFICVQIGLERSNPILPVAVNGFSCALAAGK